MNIYENLIELIEDCDPKHLSNAYSRIERILKDNVYNEYLDMLESSAPKIGKLEGVYQSSRIADYLDSEQFPHKYEEWKRRNESE
jgi:hypothetical protein